MDKEARQEFGARLRRARKNKKLTIRELAGKTGLAEATLSCYENGTRIPDLQNLANIADVLDVPTDFLISNNQEEIKNLKTLLESGELTYDGVELKGTDLIQLKGFLEFIIRNKLK
ncbi:helix-turn-helix domain-containing protein [Paenactinomyces guangxiensis]|uniref:Helix-turn-helix transcriptional regulator n=1 Tax=Paenactinomyces guangxiensis TaxID=1490290 RepID=A0A7W1WS83_9BACL|nr:helix-turn-helix transcriptional regulator [Paenactinomyces guangxiensis]MBA4495132.1 helix-turn-helix transcriptional regulator [Paenactinomyces guangxiensis]MBH8592184.1 helix-turn-helix transcriptional regulator [Paenactinomyces guangxiensis]